MPRPITPAPTTKAGGTPASRPFQAEPRGDARVFCGIAPAAARCLRPIRSINAASGLLLSAAGGRPSLIPAAPQLGFAGGIDDVALGVDRAARGGAAVHRAIAVDRRLAAALA